MGGDASGYIYIKLYDALVTPIIEYAAAIWSQQELSCISAIQNRASRYFMGVSKYTPNAAVQGDMGWKTSLNPKSYFFKQTNIKENSKMCI